MRITNKLDNVSPEAKKEIESLFSDYLGSSEVYDDLPKNLRDSTELLEVLIWGIYMMEDQGVLSSHHLEALVSYWQSGHAARVKKAANLIEKVRPILDERYSSQN